MTGDRGACAIPDLWVRVTLGVMATVVMMGASLASGDQAPFGSRPGSELALVTAGVWSFLAWRWPRVSALAAPAFTFLCFSTVTPAFTLALATGAPLFVAARLGHFRWGVLAALLTTAASGGYRLLFNPTPTIFSAGLEVAQDAMLLVALLLLGETVRQRAVIRRDAALEREVQRAEHQRRQTEQRLVIARDLHDILAHTLTLVGVQASVAAENFDRDPAVARRAIDRIRAAGVDAMADLRGTISLLRDDASPSPTDPPARSVEIATLVDNAVQAGVEVDFACAGDESAVRTAVGQAAYQVVQESLTNALRHGRATRVRIRIDYRPDLTRVEVRDNGRAAGGVGGMGDGGGGFGLRGMRERVQALGGGLTAGPASDGPGFVVTATLPRARR